MPPITVPLRAPELVAGTWIQGPPVSLAFARGAVVLVDFWESTCINCLRTLPYLIEWHRRYAERGLVVIGIHTPEFDLTATPEVVAAAVRAEGIRYPVLLDPDKENWQRFANHFWPAKYLIDARGYLRYEHFGEGAYGETEEWIQRLLREAGDLHTMPEPVAPLRPEDRPGAVCHPMTAEVYAGFHRGRLTAAEGYRPGEEVRHLGEEHVPVGMFTARGLWLHEAEFLEAREEGAEIELAYEAASVSAVLAPAGEVAGRADIALDGAPVPEVARGADVTADRDSGTVVQWERPRLVRLVDGGGFGAHRLRLRFPEPGARIYAFSFTSCVAGPG